LTLFPENKVEILRSAQDDKEGITDCFCMSFLIALCSSAATVQYPENKKC